MATMNGVVLPGDSTVKHVAVEVPEPGHGQVLLRMKASSICGSDIRAIYREHLGKGPGGLPGCDRRPRAVRPGGQGRARLQAVQGRRPRGDLPHLRLRRLRRVPARLYDQLPSTRSGRLTAGSATAATRTTCWPRRTPASACPIRSPTSTARLCRCGFGTAYEGLRRMQVSGQDRLLITGLGPVGLAAAMLGRALGATTILGTDLSPERAGWPWRATWTWSTCVQGRRRCPGEVIVN